MRQIKYIYFCLIACLLVSCEKKDQPVKLLPLPSAEVKVSAVNIGKDYESEIYFSIDSNKSVSNSIKNWDLAFEAKSLGWHVFLNGGTGVQVAESQAQSFSDNIDLASLKWKWDTSNQHPDSTGIGEWCNPTDRKGKGKIYVIDRGETFAADKRYYKLQLIYATNKDYRVMFCPINMNTNPSPMIIQKSLYANYVFFTFDKSGLDHTLLNEPGINNWEIRFLRYRYIYREYNPPLPYLVNGIWMNDGVGCIKDSLTGFEHIKKSDVVGKTFNFEKDYIGFDWKTYSSTQGKYIVRSHVTYIFKTPSNKYFKLRFIDFYNTSGERGNPKFEYAELM